MYGYAITAWGTGDSAQQHPFKCQGKVMDSSELFSKLAGIAFSASLT